MEYVADSDPRMNFRAPVHRYNVPEELERLSYLRENRVSTDFWCEQEGCE